MNENDNNNIIEIKDLFLDYEEEDGATAPALLGVSLSIEKGSFIAIVGENGSGKSSLAKCMNALLLPKSGDVIVKGMNTKDEAFLWDIRKTVGMVFQNPDNQLVSSVVEDDVAFGPENLGMEPSEIRKSVDEALKAVGMYELRKKGPHHLSGGQKQRVAIAGVLAMNCEVIVFDESSSMLDPQGRKELSEMTEKLRKSGKTIVLITHFMEEAAEADRVIVMNKGRLTAQGSPAEIFNNKELVKNAGIDIPFGAAMADELRNNGMDVPSDIITEAGLINYISSHNN